MQREYPAFALSIALILSISAPVAKAVSFSPNVCTLSQSNSSTSTDGSMFVKALAYKCPPSNTSGQAEWEAYSGRSYVATGTLNVCGSGHSFTNAEDLQGGQAAYSTICYGEYSYNFALSTLGLYSFTAHSGGVNVSEYGWSGKCSSLSVGSACAATTSASA